MPLMHAEDLLSQITCLSLIEGLEKECPSDREEKEFLANSINFTKKHRECIKSIGRFPKRNEWLGREMREDEKKWLEDHPGGF